ADGFDVLRIGLLARVAFVLLHNDAIPSENTIHRLRLRPNTNNPGQNAGLLHRWRNHTHFVDTLMFAGQAERFAGPQTVQECEAFVHQFRASLEVRRFADFRESSIIWSSTQARSENQAAVGKMVERSSLPRKLPRTPARHGGDEWTNPDALGPCGDGRKHYPRVEQCHRFSGEILNRNTIGHEYSIPTRRLRGLRHLALHTRFATWNDNPVSHAPYSNPAPVKLSWRFSSARLQTMSNSRSPAPRASTFSTGRRSSKKSKIACS